VTASPLGRYSDLAAALVAVLLVVAAVSVHLAIALLNATAHPLGVVDTAWLDTSAGLAVGVVLGQRATTNGAARIADAANQRLDKIGAPPAANGGGTV
jgi:hypothetical protein